MVASEWMENGNINMFVKANTDADRLQLVRFFYGTYVLFLDVKAHMDILA